MENKLNPKEQSILTLMLQGKQNKEIGALLHLSIDAVKKYNTSIFKKLGVTNRHAAIVKMITINT